ncbi:MAG: type II toxin-antitoxin system HipA family toxin [Kineosporiaceae bacterium]
MTAATARDLTTVKDVEAADVHKAGRPAARLRRTSDGVEFTYRDDYLAAPDARPVATTLPLDDRPVVTPAGAVPPFFAGLLPEGRRLSALRRAVKTSADDELSLLLAVGDDLVGDVQVLPVGTEPRDTEPLVVIAGDPGRVVFADVLSDAGVVDPVSIPGIQDKVSARMISVPVGRAGGFAILKVDPLEFPHVVLNEAYFLGVAARARFPVVRAEVVHDATDRPGLLVERFDRVVTPDGSVRRLAVEDAAQVLGRYPADKYSVRTEEVAVALAARCPARAVALRDVFRQVCLAWLTGNGDLHAKNLSILAAPDGEWRVAPAYDLPSTLPYRDRTTALPVGGRRDGLSRRSLLAFATATGLPAAAAERTLDEVLAATAGVVDELAAGALPFDPRTTHDVVRSLRNRRRACVRTSA